MSCALYNLFKEVFDIPLLSVYVYSIFLKSFSWILICRIMCSYFSAFGLILGFGFGIILDLFRCFSCFNCVEQ